MRADGERHQATQRLALEVVKVDLFLLAREVQGIVQEHLVHLDHVAGQLVNKLAVGDRRHAADHPQHKLVLGHSRNVAVHPGRHAAMHVRVAALEY